MTRVSAPLAQSPASSLFLLLISAAKISSVKSGLQLVPAEVTVTERKQEGRVGVSVSIDGPVQFFLDLEAKEDADQPEVVSASANSSDYTNSLRLMTGQVVWPVGGNSLQSDRAIAVYDTGKSSDSSSRSINNYAVLLPLFVCENIASIYHVLRTTPAKKLCCVVGRTYVSSV